MICSNCQTTNADDYIYCVNCGVTVNSQDPPHSEPPETQFLPNRELPPTRSVHSNSNSIETQVSPPVRQAYQTNQNISPSFEPVPAFLGERQHGKSKNGIVLAGVALILLVAAGAGAIYFFNKQSFDAGALPDHLGMFVQRNELNRVEEIKKQDFVNALDGKDSLLKDDNLTIVEGNPNLILYSDSKDIPLNDLKLIQLDTIKDDGALKQLSFQAALIDGKPDMKRIRVPDGLANGKYAFALFDGYFDEGKHKFWAFQVKNAAKTSNDDALKSTTVLLKPKTSSPTPTPASTTTPPNNPPETPPGKNTSPPTEGTTAFCTSDNVIFRSGPSQSSAPIGKLYRGQRLYVLGYSNNYEYFKDYYSNFVQVETADGLRGWVYAIYVKK